MMTFKGGNGDHKLFNTTELFFIVIFVIHLDTKQI